MLQVVEIGPLKVVDHQASHPIPQVDQGYVLEYHRDYVVILYVALLLYHLKGLVEIL